MLILCVDIPPVTPMLLSWRQLPTRASWLLRLCIGEFGVQTGRPCLSKSENDGWKQVSTVDLQPRMCEPEYTHMQTTHAVVL